MFYIIDTFVPAYFLDFANCLLDVDLKNTDIFRSLSNCYFAVSFFITNLFVLVVPALFIGDVMMLTFCCSIEWVPNYALWFIMESVY